MKNTKMKYRKIRGINRCKLAIDQWGDNHERLNIDLLNQQKRNYVKFWVQPWSRLCLTNSIYPEPTGDFEHLLIKNLKKIYQSWDSALRQIQTLYYLQIWLFEKYVSRSQVVCAVEGYKDFYQNTFEQVKEQPTNGIQGSTHYNVYTAEYLDCVEWKLYRRLESYDITDEDDIETLKKIDPTKLIRKEVIENKEYQIVEIDKVWLVS